MSSAGGTSLQAALTALLAVAGRAGVAEDVARTEALSLAAALAESAPGASADWAAVTPGADTQDFFNAASRGRRWRGAPTAVLTDLVAQGSAEKIAYAEALAEVASAACGLGEPTMRVIGNASVAAAAQLQAAGARRPAVHATPSPPGGAPGTPGANPPGLPGGTPSASTPALPGGARGLLGADLAGLLSGARELLGADLAGLLGTDTPGSDRAGGAGSADTLGSDRAGGAGSGGPLGELGSGSAGTTGSSSAGTSVGGAAAVGGVAAVASAVEAAPVVPERTVEELLAELDELTGLKNVKREVHRQVAVLRVEKLRVEAGLKSPTITRHLVFTGNPGTGKTTVARLVSGIYKALGLLSKGQLIEVDRSELVAGYLGQTATKTAEVVASAVGGVLFIDEAYSLTAGELGADQYGREAVDTLVKEMEDRRDDLVVIVAGYPEPMQDFIAANPGLASRFRTTIAFEDYTDDELADILGGLTEGADYELTPNALDEFKVILASTRRDRSFGNGRFARNMLEAAIGRHAWRLRDVTAPTTEQLRQILAEDLTDEELTPKKPSTEIEISKEEHEQGETA